MSAVTEIAVSVLLAYVLFHGLNAIFWQFTHTRTLNHDCHDVYCET